MQHRNLRNRTAPKKQKGFSLLEVTVVFVIILAIVAILFVAFGGAQESQRSQAAQQQALQLVAGIKKIATGPNYTGITQDLLRTSGNAPANMVSGTTLVNTFGGTVTIAAANVGTGGSNNGYAITYPLVPRAECNAVVSGLRDTFKIIRVGSTVVKDSVAATPVVYSIATTTAACDNENNTLVLTNT
jgi:type IV pilus assembly protein PilA